MMVALKVAFEIGWFGCCAWLVSAVVTLFGISVPVAIIGGLQIVAGFSWFLMLGILVGMLKLLAARGLYRLAVWLAGYRIRITIERI